MSVGWGVLRNFHAHAKEMGTSPPSEPLFFLIRQVLGKSHLLLRQYAFLLILALDSVCD